MKIEAKILKLGNSQGVTIPPAVLKLLGYELGDKVILEIKEKGEKK